MSIPPLDARLLVCSTCDGYEFIPGAGGILVDCPDCRAIDPRPQAWCPVHSVRLTEDRTCPRCVREARRGVELLTERAREAARSAA